MAARKQQQQVRERHAAGRSARVGLLMALILVALAACSPEDATWGGEAAGQSKAEPGGRLATSGGKPQSLRAAYIESMQASAGEVYRLAPAPAPAAATLVGRNPSHGLALELSGGAVRVVPTAGELAWELQLRWASVGRGADLRPISRPEGPAQVQHNRASYRRGDGQNEEWYLNGPLGIEQGFTIAEPPAGDGALVLRVEVGGLTPEVSADGQIDLRSHAGKVALRYTDLLAVDADGQWLEATMTASGQGVQLEIADAGARYPIAIDPLVWVEQAKLYGGEPTTDDQLGISVSIDGDTALVGAHQDDERGVDSGAAYVFVRSAGVWVQQAKLMASAGTTHFGTSVSLSGDSALVGADDGAYVFVRSAGVWSEQAELVTGDAANGFGAAVALQLDTAVVGAPEDDDGGSDAGAGYVFTRSGTVWSLQAKLPAGDAAADDRFGTAVSLDGDTAVVGALHDDDAGLSSGSAYVFTRSGTVWTQEAKLVAADAEADDWFGSSVSVWGDTALIGAPRDDYFVADCGSAYVFTRSGTVWTEEAHLLATPVSGGDHFGGSVSLSGDTVLIGAAGNDDANIGAGAAYVFTRSGAVWTLEDQLFVIVLAAYGYFGTAVSVAGSDALVGAPYRDFSNTDSGAAFVFVNSGGAWAEQDEIGISSPGSSDDFGAAVSIHLDTAIVGRQSTTKPSPRTAVLHLPIGAVARTGSPRLSSSQVIRRRTTILAQP